MDQYAYDVWGKPALVSETVPQQLRYQGYWYDNELGWYWLTTRSYDPALKRFLQPDPSETDGLFSYVYVKDDPVDGSDPSGFMATTHHGDCGPDAIYCGGLPDYQEVAPTGPSDPCYYNADACAPEGHVTSGPETSPVSGGLVSLGTTTSQVANPAGINIPNIDLRVALFGPLRDKVIPVGTYKPGSTVFAIAAVGPGMGRMVIDYSYAEPGDARTQDEQGNVRPVRIAHAQAEIVFMKPCPEDDICQAYGYFAPGARITLVSLYWYSPAEFYPTQTKWYQTLPASLLRKYPPQPGQTIGIHLD